MFQRTATPPAFRCTLAVLLLAAAATSAADREVASYDIEVRLDPVTHRLAGSERVRWTNTTSATTAELRLHLYLNAFAGPDTTFMRELDASPLHDAELPQDGWGWIRIDGLVLDDGSDLLAGLEFIRPDDGNQEDLTLARVPLPREVPPGDAVELHIRFEAQLPKVVSRTGYVGDFHLVAQWFPKLAVFEDGRWHGHQFHADSEFYADFGSYRMQLTVPQGWVVGASGIETGRAAAEPGWQTVSYRAQNVHDAAWCVAPSELMQVVEADFEPGRHVPTAWLAKARARLGLSAAELELPPMRIRLLLPRSQDALAARMTRAARLAVAWYGLHYGPYPYPQLTVVSPPPEASAAGAMEYPTFITTGAGRLTALPPWSLRPDIESLTVHEFAHQYFQGMLASDEFEEAWLDEGLASYTEVSCLADMAADGLIPGIPLLDLWAAERIALARAGRRVVPATAAWDFADGDSYYLGSYTRPALVLRTLEGLIGGDAMARGLRIYVERHAFAHPTGRDLVAALSEAAGRDLGPFFEQTIWGDSVPDWGVQAVRQEAVDGGQGSADGGGDGAWSVRVDLVRSGDLAAPVEVELVWDDGSVERRLWEAADRSLELRLTASRRLAQVVIDPDGVWLLETRRADNYWRDRPASPGRVLRWLAELRELAAVLLLRSS